MTTFLCSKNISEFISSIDTVLVDCDGVLWQGNTPIENSPATISKLKDLGKRVFYLTNNSTKSRASYVKKLISLGFPAEKEDVIGSSYLTACYLKSRDFQKTAYVVGTTGISDELEEVGIKSVGVGPDPMKDDMVVVVSGGVDLHKNIGAVIVGFDSHISYLKIMKAASYLKNPECIFIGTNTDEVFPMNSELLVPGTGSILAAVRTAAGREPVVMGKPSTYALEVLQKHISIDPSRALMVGDRCSTDIMFGNRCGFHTLMVLTGVNKLLEVEEWRRSGCEEYKDYLPDYYMDKLGDMLRYL